MPLSFWDMAAVITQFKLMAVLLVCGIILMGPTMDMSCGAAACPLYCLDVDYATCSSSGDEQRSASCNCCLSGLTGSGCVLHLTGGGTITC
ncbi:hypothetical protein AKJ16_DCAP24602 [Drosera capensis]